MSRLWPTLPGIIFCVVFVLGAFILANRTSDIQPAAEIVQHSDQSRYAEVATTSEERVVRIASTTTAIQLPILVYHIVRPAYPDDSRAVRALALTPETFDNELLYLALAGYHVISFTDLENYFLRNEPLPKKPIILTFDDGWKDQFTYAFPLLLKNHFSATFFVFTNAIGRPDFVSWEDLKVMRDAGMTIGSHSRSHPYLTRIASTTTLQNEIRGSRRILEEHLGIPITEFAYPFGRYNADIVTMVKEAGYRSARGDFESGKQSLDRLFELSALNAPTTTVLFEKKFPISGYRGR